VKREGGGKSQRAVTAIRKKGYRQKKPEELISTQKKKPANMTTERSGFLERGEGSLTGLPLGENRPNPWRIYQRKKNRAWLKEKKEEAEGKRRKSRLFTVKRPKGEGGRGDSASLSPGKSINHHLERALLQDLGGNNSKKKGVRRITRILQKKRPR